MAKRQRKSSLILISLVLISLFTYDYFADGKLRDSIGEYFSGDKKTSKKPERKSRSRNKSKQSRPKSPISYEEIKGKFYNVYFSQVYEGDPKTAERNPNSMDRKLAQVIRRAKKQVYAALQELDSQIITDAILYVHKNGVEVKIVTEDKYKDEESIRRLKRVGIPVVDDSSGPKGKLMHNKFIIIDGEWVWTGSFNTTDNGSYKNNNNSLLIRSPKLAENFIDEFNEMFVGKYFGYRSPKNIKYRSIRFPDGTTIRTLFAPENGVAKALTQEIRKAKKSIYFMAFSFTHDGMGKAMIEKYKDGIQVKGVFEKRGNKKSKYSEYGQLKNAGIQSIQLDRNKYAMHHKVIIIDERVTITGSFNFSNNANKRNDENVLIIDNPRIAKAYIDEFQRIYQRDAQ